MRKPENDRSESDLMSLHSEPRIKVTREIPLPWLLTVLAAIAGGGATVWFNQQTTNEKLTKVLVQMDTVAQSLDEGRQANRDLKYDVRDLDRRLTAVEKGAKP